MTRLVLIGAGGHGKVVADTAQDCGFSNIVFVDKTWPRRKKNGRLPIVGKGDEPDFNEDQKFCTIGKNLIREQLFHEYRLEASPVLVHPSAVLSSTVRLGAGTVVVAGAIVNADATIGRGVILNTCCSIDHDCILNDFVHISPGARLAGSVTVGARSWIGIGAVVKEGVQIGHDVIVAAGAAVIGDLENGARVGGVPARAI